LSDAETFAFFAALLASALPASEIFVLLFVVLKGGGWPAVYFLDWPAAFAAFFSIALALL